MDLRAMLNTDGAGRGAAHPSTQPPHPPPTPTTGAPATPIQTGPPPHTFYSHPSHASPVAQPREYIPATAGAHPVSYASPTSYHPPPNAFAGRQPVPPLQPLSAHDVRSPGASSMSAHSPYRQTPTSSVSANSAGYPFPPPQPQQQPLPNSPGQRPQYGPPSLYGREVYGAQQRQPTHPPTLGIPVSHGSLSYAQGEAHGQPHQTIPQTPPVGTPGGSHQYLNQRSLSIQSTPTPTSAHSQNPPPYGSFSQGSPIATTQHPSHLEQHYHRQSPQPPTPLGPPMSFPPRPSPTSHQQPPSPYQQRISVPTQYSHQPIHSSPPPLPPNSIPRMPMSMSNQGSYDAAAESHRRSQSQTSRSERERSVSVSPKTRVPSLPSSAGHHHSSISSESNSHAPPPQTLTLPGVHNNMPPSADSRATHDATPAKRKLDERGLQPEELENRRPPPPPPKMNGDPMDVSQSSASPMVPRRRRVYRDGPPVWALSGKNSSPNASRNFSLKQHVNPTGQNATVNGNHHEPALSVHSDRASRQPSPEMARTTPSVKPEEASQPIVKEGPPFPWEASIENQTPLDPLSRAVSDFIGAQVVRCPNLEEINARGIQFEIEAKLGTIIDKNTNDRIYFPLSSGECVMSHEARIAFRSSMTENQHRELNEYLNEQVKASFHRNPNAASRVPVQYVHRREVDRFFELPVQMRQRLPVCMSALLPPNTPLKARISYDQKTEAVLAKIVKARVADLHIHLPHLPLDCRISINFEWEWEGPPEEIERHQIPNKDRPPDRNKDRLSYTHGYYQIDLTQVTQSNAPQQPAGGGGGGPNKEHELEVELNSQALLEHGRYLVEQRPTRYGDLIEGFVNNIRVLAKRCPQPEM